MRLLILGGTAEAAAIAEQAVARSGVEVITSLAGRTRAPRRVPGEQRIGGFGGPEAMAGYLRDERIDVLVDAPHPFAVNISANAAAACDAAGVPRLMLVRPPWQPGPDDNWIGVADGPAAAAEIAARGFRRAFLATGRQELPAFAGLADIWLLVRLVDAPSEALPLVNYDVVTGRGPFVEDEEHAMLSRHGIDVIVAKNAGGAGSWPKMAAARRLGIPVVMIERAETQAGETVQTVADVMAWLERFPF